MRIVLLLADQHGSRQWQDASILPVVPNLYRLLAVLFFLNDQNFSVAKTTAGYLTSKSVIEKAVDWMPRIISGCVAKTGKWYPKH